MSEREVVEFVELLEKTITAIHPMECVGAEEVLFECSDGTSYVMYHDQDCCESVSLDDVTGDIADLLGRPLLIAEEVSEDIDVEDGDARWTFYKMATTAGYVTLRWHGSSNGYYAIGVTFARVLN